MGSLVADSATEPPSVAVQEHSTRLAPNILLIAHQLSCMGLLKHTVNGVISLAISVAITVLLAEDGDSYSLSEVALSVAISAFLSGFFTSYFAKDD